MWPTECCLAFWSSALFPFSLDFVRFLFSIISRSKSIVQERCYVNLGYERYRYSNMDRVFGPVLYIRIGCIWHYLCDFLDECWTTGRLYWIGHVQIQYQRFDSKIETLHVLLFFAAKIGGVSKIFIRTPSFATIALVSRSVFSVTYL